MVFADSVAGLSKRSCSGLFVRVAISVALAPIVGAAGCGKPANTVSVHGHVAYRGESLTKGSVTFFPATGRPVTAAIAEDGDYSAELEPGEYVVVVSVGTELPLGFQEGDPVPPPKVVLPAEYTTRVRSKLTATVRAESDQPIDFALK